MSLLARYKTSSGRDPPRLVNWGRDMSYVRETEPVFTEQASQREDKPFRRGATELGNELKPIYVSVSSAHKPGKTVSRQ